MSGIGGVYNADGSPVDGALLQRMRDIIAHRGPDGAGIWSNRNVGLIHRLLWNSEESVHEKQPMTNGRGLWITADCRIDNREELKREFRMRGLWKEMENLFDPFAPPDSTYILFAYELWKEDSPLHLLGDFAFAIWDEQSQKLFCVRDQAGMKSFVYYWCGQKFLFGSEIKQLFQDPAVPSILNLAHLAEILIMNYSNREETPYQAIRRLPPAHSIRIERGRFLLKKYWNWDPNEEPRSKASVQENAEEFRHLFQEAVRARLRVPPGCRVGSLLSGGLDSSSIVSIAASIQKDKPFPVFTMCFPEADPAYHFKKKDWVDETSYSEPLVQKYGLESHKIWFRGFGPTENLEENFWYHDMPFPYPLVAYCTFAFRTARDAGVRGLLDGNGGDELFRVGQQLAFKNLKGGDSLSGLKELLEKRRGLGISYASFFNSLVRHFIPTGMKRSYRHLFSKAVPPWINPFFAKQIELKERVQRDFISHRNLRDSAFGISCWLWANRIALDQEIMDRMAAASNLELRLPFVDLRLFRFSASLPWNQKEYDGVKKVLLREALKDALPSVIRFRLRKTEFSPVVRTGLERYSFERIKETFETPHPILNSMVAIEKVRRLYKNYFYPRRPHHSVQTYQRFWYLWNLISIDHWLKQTKSFTQRPKEVNHEPQTVSATEAEGAQEKR